MGTTSRKRKFIVLFGLVIAVLALVLVALPLWFPWVLPSIIKKYGISYARYERDGYSRFVLRDVKFAQPKAEFQAERVEILFPTTFLWRNFTDDRTENYLRVSDWTLEFSHAAGEKKPGTNSVFHAVKKSAAILEELNRWLPKAILDKGTIHFADKTIAIPVAEWADGNLSGRIVSQKLFPETFFQTHLGGKFPKGILIENPGWNLGGELVIAREANDRLEIEGRMLWHSNRIDLAAQFDPEGSLPETASVKSKSFQIPAQILKLEGYGDLTGTLDFEWKTNRFALDFTADARPIQDGKIFLSPVTAVIHASGDTHSVRIETATVSSPWLEAKLSKNVEFNFHGEMLSPSATLQIAANLSGQKWIDATGQLSGEAVLRGGKNRFPDTAFNLVGMGIGVHEIEMDRLDLQGELNWPWLRVDSAKIQFKEGATAQANLKFNAVARQIAEGKLRLNGSIGHKFLPPEISYKNVSLDAEFFGPLKKISHSAHAELRGVKLPSLAPLGVVAEWRGTQLDFPTLQVAVSAKGSSLAFGGAANFQTNQIGLRVETLALKKNAQLILEQEKPTSISLTKAQGEKTFSDIKMEPLRWRGSKTEISLAGKIQWPEQGNVSASVTNVAISTFQDFFERPLAEAMVERLNFSGHWTNGPVEFGTDALAQFVSADGTPFSAELRSIGNAKGLSIETAKIGTASESVLSGAGLLPLTIVPGNRSNLLQALPKQQIDFRAETIPNTQFWEELAKWTQTTFREPRVSLAISGTFDAPQGKVTASVKEIVLKPKEPNQPVPRFQKFFADFDLVREHIALNRFEVFVEGQPVTATGKLPLPTILQTDWKKIFDWRKANAHLKIVDAQIAPFERLFPKILSPLGTVNLDLAIAGGKLEGELRVADAALRPIPSLGPVHDIAARMKFLGEKVTLETFEGNLGGQPVSLSGEINLANRKTNELPDFHFNLRGTNVPLARSPDLILRSDIDLAIANKKGDEPLVSGALNLRDSFYLSDLKLLIPGKVAKPKQRPPYFSVETEPFAKWRLDVAVQGTNFLKVRSPLFRGELSANLKLEGTLREPAVLGDARINFGVVQFPFANLRVDQGFISLRSENPYRPQLSVATSARTYGYDVKMDVNGFADKPVIEFSSNPGLTSEQILLMVTAGELPRDEVNFSTQQKAGRLAFFLGKNLISKFGATDARDDKLEIRSGENVSEQGRQTYYLEYKLTDDWSITGEYDRFGGVNAGFKWKFFQK